jgi:hypothetical protein
MLSAVLTLITFFPTWRKNQFVFIWHIIGSLKHSTVLKLEILELLLTVSEKVPLEAISSRNVFIIQRRLNKLHQNAAEICLIVSLGNKVFSLTKKKN